MSGAAVKNSVPNTERWWKPGQSGNPAGKPKGAVTKLNRSIKDMILTALNDVGGAQYLARQAEANPVAFMGLVGKVLPLQLANADGSNALVIDFRWADAPPTIEAAPVVETVSHETTEEEATPQITFISDC